MRTKLFYRKRNSDPNTPTKPLKQERFSVQSLDTVQKAPLRLSQPQHFDENSRPNRINISPNFRSLRCLIQKRSQRNSLDEKQSQKGLYVNSRQREAANHNRRLDFKLIYQIGFGGFGKVWKIQEHQTYAEYAMKEISKKKVLDKDNVATVMNERCILSGLQNPFIINMREGFQDRENLYMVMDYLKGGDLRYHICYRHSFSEAETKFLLSNILLGLDYIRSKGIIHRDIKPENIVLQETGYARITDFGISKLVDTDEAQQRTEPSGTPGYMAPEILEKKPYSFSADYFAIGVIAHQLALGYRPYDGQNRAEIRAKMKSTEVQITSAQLPKGWSPRFKGFVNGLIKHNPTSRLGHNDIVEIMNHPWLADLKWKKIIKKTAEPPFVPNNISQKREYLDEIEIYQMDPRRCNNENAPPLSPIEQRLFQSYDLPRKAVLELQRSEADSRKKKLESHIRSIM